MKGGNVPGVIGIIGRLDHSTAVSCREITVRGFEELRAATPTTSSEIIQIEAGCMQGRLKHTSVAGLSVGFGSFSRGLISRGVYSDERVTIGFRTDRSGVDRQPLGGVRIWSPGVEHQSRYVAGASFGAISVSIEDLVRYFGPGSRYSDSSAWRASNSFRTPETGASVQVLRSIMRGFDRYARKIAPAEAEFWKKAIIESACFTIANSERFDMFGASPQRLVRRAQEFLDGSGGAPVHIAELLSVVGASRRALHRAFDEVIGTPPMTYLRQRRLCEARLLLRQGTPGEVTVAEVAFRQGFADLGRFSRYYRELFGENPSETLKGSL